MNTLDTIIHHRVARLLVLMLVHRLSFARIQRLIRHIRAEVQP